MYSLVQLLSALGSSLPPSRPPTLPPSFRPSLTHGGLERFGHQNYHPGQGLVQRVVSHRQRAPGCTRAACFSLPPSARPSLQDHDQNVDESSRLLLRLDCDW